MPFSSGLVSLEIIWVRERDHILSHSLLTIYKIGVQQDYNRIPCTTLGRLMFFVHVTAKIYINADQYTNVCFSSTLLW